MDKEQQLKELREKINESLNKLNELEANYKKEKPVIEVGKVYKENGWMLFIKSKHDNFEKEGWCDVFGFHRDGNFINDQRVVEGEDWIEATKEEWETALTQYFDKLYEGVEKVDRSCLLENIRCYKNDIDSFNKVFGVTKWGEDGFRYKGRYVMDKHGNIAKPVKDEVKEEWHFEYFGNWRYTFNFKKELEKGKYKLVKVN